MKIAASFLLAMTAILTLAPFVAALGYQTVVIARNEAIFNCSKTCVRELNRKPETDLLLFLQVFKNSKTAELSDFLP
jgi:hypothetical protein